MFLIFSIGAFALFGLAVYRYNLSRETEFWALLTERYGTQKEIRWRHKWKALIAVRRYDLKTGFPVEPLKGSQVDLFIRVFSSQKGIYFSPHGFMQADLGPIFVPWSAVKEFKAGRLAGASMVLEGFSGDLIIRDDRTERKCWRFYSQLGNGNA